MASCGLPRIISLSSMGPGLLFLRFGLDFFGILYYYQYPGLGLQVKCPSRE